jgi:hypothetical protein
MTPALALTLAAAVWLTGCQAQAPTSSLKATFVAREAGVAAPLAAKPVSPAVTVTRLPQATAEATPIGEAMAAALAHERAAEDLAGMAGEEAAYGLMALEAQAGEAKPGKPGPFAKLRAALAARLGARKAKVKQRLEGLRETRQAVRKIAKEAPWTDNGDGTKTQVVSLPLEAPHAGQRTLTRTLRTEDTVLLKLEATLDQTGPRGGHTTMKRTKTLLTDGSYEVVVHAEVKAPGGGERLIDYTKRIGLDGVVTGSGTLLVKRGGVVVKQLTLALGGSEDRETIKAEDGEGSTEVALPLDGAPAAVATDATGAATPVTLAPVAAL